MGALKGAQNILKSNKSIVDAVLDAGSSGYRMMGDIIGHTSPKEAFNKMYMQGGKTAKGAMKTATRAGMPSQGVKSVTKGIKQKQGLNYAKMAGGYMGLSAGARVIGGGGLTRDRNGKSDLIGVPFV